MLPLQFRTRPVYSQPAPTGLYTLSLHDALPIWLAAESRRRPPQCLDVEVPDRGSGTSTPDRKSTRLNSSHVKISYAVFGLKKKRHRRTIYAGCATPPTSQRI